MYWISCHQTRLRLAPSLEAWITYFLVLNIKVKLWGWITHDRIVIFRWTNLLNHWKSLTCTLHLLKLVMQWWKKQKMVTHPPTREKVRHHELRLGSSSVFCVKTPLTAAVGYSGRTPARCQTQRLPEHVISCFLKCALAQLLLLVRGLGSVLPRYLATSDLMTFWLTAHFPLGWVTMMEKACLPYVKPKRKDKRQRWLEMGESV